MELTGIHHLSAVTANPKQNLAFFTQTLGLRLVKKTVNQDDVTAYHLFYADGRGSPGTDVTFFHYPAHPERRGTRAIVRTGLRVPGEAALDYWHDRLTRRGVKVDPIATRDGRRVLDFEDAETQRLTLVTDDAADDVTPWEQSDVPPEHQIRGLGPVTISVPELNPTDVVLRDVLGFRPTRAYDAPISDRATEGLSRVYVYEIGPGGSAARELHVAVEPMLKRTVAGAGGVHHVAFRIPTFEEYDAWAERLQKLGVPNSGPVDRFYFRSLYLREPGGVLFELATDGPGFHADEPMDALGQRLSLPPFLESNRTGIEAGLEPL